MIGWRRNRSWLGAAFSLAALAIALLCFVFRASSQPHYKDSFASGRTAEWNAHGGSWDLYQGAIRNNSDERGAKLITGSPAWRDYSVDADLLLLGQDGDAGLIVRSSDEEEGVDAYDGYYVGLRDRNNTVVIGRADHGWMEYQAVPVSHPIRPFHWYHLRVVAVSCEIAAVARDPDTQEETTAAMRESDCARQGRIGLRSYSSGGLWKNVRVEPATAAGLAIDRSSQVADSPERMQTEMGFNSLLPYSGKPTGPSDSASINPAMNIHTPSLSSLRFASGLHPSPVTVRASVVLTAPVLYIEDGSGGAAVESPLASSVKIGDELEVTGIVDARPVGVVLRAARLRLLWSRSPAPPLSVTASQAATGAFDGMLVEIEGRLKAKSRVRGESVVLDLENGYQGFHAVLEGARQDLMFDQLQPNSVLRLTGVSVADPAYTQNLTSFALLLRSSEDVSILSGPPWWDTRYLVEGALLLMLVLVIAVFIYFRAEHWRMSAVVEERSRMAREIHDTLAQSFAGIALQLESALQGTRSGVDREPVELALKMAWLSRREAHRSITALRTLHTDEPLETMLSKVLRPQITDSHVQLSISSAGLAQRLPSECEGQILRIAQETVANAIQHGTPTSISVRLGFRDQKLTMEIEDDGRGFDVSRSPSSEDGHFGITGMRERAANMKADLSIESGREGTRVSLIVPIPPRRRFGRVVGDPIQRLTRTPLPRLFRWLPFETSNKL